MKSLIEDLVAVALAENQRAVDQALRGHRTGERTEDGALWDTCFSHAFTDVLKEHGAYVPDQCGHVWIDEDGAKRICTELRGHLGKHDSIVSEPDAADLELAREQLRRPDVRREVERLNREPGLLAIGQPVRTNPQGQRHYTDEAHLVRRRGMGLIVDQSDRHGLCYGVYHRVDGSVAWYDPDELELAPTGSDMGPHLLDHMEGK
jgi:hypothetical protein